MHTPPNNPEPKRGRGRPRGTGYEHGTVAGYVHGKCRDENCVCRVKWAEYKRDNKLKATRKVAEDRAAAAQAAYLAFLAEKRAIEAQKHAEYQEFCAKRNAERIAGGEVIDND